MVLPLLAVGAGLGLASAGNVAGINDWGHKIPFFGSFFPDRPGQEKARQMGRAAQGTQLYRPYMQEGYQNALRESVQGMQPYNTAMLNMYGEGIGGGDMFEQVLNPDVYTAAGNTFKDPEKYFPRSAQEQAYQEDFQRRLAEHEADVRAMPTRNYGGHR